MRALIQQELSDDHATVLEEKQRIADNFSRAAQYYDKADRLQRRVARRLMLHLPEEAKCLIDLGCGTGKWTRALSERYEYANVIGVDFAWGMLQKVKKQQVHIKNGIADSHILCCAGDIEALPLVNNSVDLIFSSLAVQWCSDLGRVLEEAARVLMPGGTFVFSTLAEGSLSEMQHLWGGIDELSHANEYLSFADQRQICLKSPLIVQHLHCMREVLYYENVMSLLREFKALGANTVTRGGQKGLMTPAKLQRFMLAYERLREVEGVPCTYQVVYSVLKKV